MRKRETSLTPKIAVPRGVLVVKRKSIVGIRKAVGARKHYHLRLRYAFPTTRPVRVTVAVVRMAVTPSNVGVTMAPTTAVGVRMSQGEHAH